MKVNPKQGSAGAPFPCGGAGLTPGNTPFSDPAEFGRSRSNGTSVMEIHLKKLNPSRPSFQGYSRSSEPTRAIWAAY